MNELDKKELLGDLALGELNQREIGEKFEMTQQNVGYYLKANKLEIEKIRYDLITTVSKEMMQRMVMEARKANKLVRAYDDDTMSIPSKEEQDYIKTHDSKVVGLIKGIVAPQSQDTNINVTKNETIQNINSDVLKMFHAGATAQIELNEAEIVKEANNVQE